MKSFYIVRKNTFVGMIEPNDHTVAVIVYAQHILVKGFINV